MVCPMTERQIVPRKSWLVLTARFPVVNWRSRPVAKSALANDSQTTRTVGHWNNERAKEGYNDALLYRGYFP